MPRQRWMTGVWLGCVGLLVLAGATLAWATNNHVVVVSRGGLAPSWLEVRVGERVRWQAAGDQDLGLAFDPHLDEHKIVTRRWGKIYAVFLTPGEHWYEAALGRNGEAAMFRGTVVVREPGGPLEGLPVCNDGRWTDLCVAP